MISWVLDHLPWWTSLAVGGVILAGLFVLLRSFGIPLKVALSGVGAVAVSLLAGSIYQKGRRSGVESAEARQKRADDTLVRSADDIADAVSGRTDEENRRRLKAWSKR